MKPGADLRRLNLDHLDLGGCDLTGADLRGASCVGTRFHETILHGANLRGARLFMADLGEAIGLDLTGAELHPFFTVNPEDPVGGVQYFATLTEAADAGTFPSNLVSLANGHLFWIQGDEARLRQITPAGVSYHLREAQDRRLLGLVQDRPDRLWRFGDATYATLTVRDPLLDPPGRAYLLSTQPSRFVDKPLSLRPVAAGGVVARVPSGLMHFRTPARGLFQVGELALPFGPGQSEFRRTDQLHWTADGKRLIAYGPDRTGLFVAHTQGGQPQVLPLPPEARVQGLAEAPGNRIWFIQTSPDAVVRYDLDAKNVVPAFLEPDQRGARTPGRIVVGQDGRPWFTLPGRCSIARLTPEGQVQEFALGAGITPDELVPSQDGRLFFTVTGMNVIGAITVVPPAPAKAPPAEDKSPGVWEEPPKAPAPSADGGTEAARAGTGVPDAASARAPETETKAAPGLALAEAAPAAVAPAGTGSPAPAAAPAEPEAAPAGPGPRVELKLPATAAAVPAPRLEALNIHLPAERVGHILERHGFGTGVSRSEFHGAFSTPGALPDLLTRGLLDVGEVARIRSTNGHGNYVTFCQASGAGFYLDGRTSRWAATDRFVVVTSRYPRAGNWHFDVFTAYPVR
jgi:hypothetical protein